MSEKPTISPAETYVLDEEQLAELEDAELTSIVRQFVEDSPDDDSGTVDETDDGFGP